MGFDRGTNENGVKVSWRWEAGLETGITMSLEFLAEHPELGGGKVKVLPIEGNVSALNIIHDSMVFDLHDKTELTAEMLDGEGLETVIGTATCEEKRGRYVLVWLVGSTIN